jgi:hypothetical protein
MDKAAMTLMRWNNNLYAGGMFTNAGGVLANYIAQWNGSGWTALGSGMNDNVWALAVYGSNLVAGGQFSAAGGTPANRVAKWNGSSWDALGSGLNDQVRALAAYGSNLYVGGMFTTAGGSPAARIAKWNGSSWEPLGAGLGIVSGFYDPWVDALLVLSDTQVYAGGWFTSAGGKPASYIARWNGSSWEALGSGMNGAVYALAAYGDDFLYAGGGFEVAGGKVCTSIARGYLRALPELSLRHSGGGVMVSWPSADTASFTFEHADTLGALASWVTNAAAITDDGTNKSVTVPATNSARFFRLRGP